MKSELSDPYYIQDKIEEDQTKRIKKPRLNSPMTSFDF